MISLKLSIIFIQMFAAVFMSLTYFRSKYEFLNICDKNMHSEINKTKISLVKTITREKEIKLARRNKDIFKLSIVSFIFIILIFLFNFYDFEYLATFFNLNIFFSFIIIFIIYFVYLAVRMSELITSILTFKIYKIFFDILYLVSKKSYISGLGFIYLFSSFIFSILSELGNPNAQYFQIFETFATFYTILGLTVVGLIIKSYYQVK